MVQAASPRLSGRLVLPAVAAHRHSDSKVFSNHCGACAHSDRESWGQGESGNLCRFSTLSRPVAKQPRGRYCICTHIGPFSQVVLGDHFSQREKEEIHMLAVWWDGGYKVGKSGS